MKTNILQISNDVKILDLPKKNQVVMMTKEKFSWTKAHKVFGDKLLSQHCKEIPMSSLLRESSVLDQLSDKQIITGALLIYPKQYHIISNNYHGNSNDFLNIPDVSLGENKRWKIPFYILQQGHKITPNVGLFINPSSLETNDEGITINIASENLNSVIAVEQIFKKRFEVGKMEAITGIPTNTHIELPMRFNETIAIFVRSNLPNPNAGFETTINIGPVIYTFSKFGSIVSVADGPNTECYVLYICSHAEIKLEKIIIDLKSMQTNLGEWSSIDAQMRGEYALEKFIRDTILPKLQENEKTFGELGNCTQYTFCTKQLEEQLKNTSIFSFQHVSIQDVYNNTVCEVKEHLDIATKLRENFRKIKK
ncbi:MAG: hypothetical protein AB1391_02905 [Candidatus Micrarchaeota archaeon]